LITITFGKWLELKRSEKDLSQADLAEAVGVNRQTISNWESNRTEPTLSIDSTDKLLKVLGANFEELRQAKLGEILVTTTSPMDKK